MDKDKLPPTVKLPPSTASSSSPSTTTSSFSHDLSRMADNPPRNVGHRRAHSEILTLPDDINFESDLGIVGGDYTEDDLFSMYIDMDQVNSSGDAGGGGGGGSWSGVNYAEAGGGGGGGGGFGQSSGGNERPRGRHQHSQSMDGSMNIKPEMLVGGGSGIDADAKKAMSAAKLAELALIDPKRAKRIWANRQSAARSKERKMRYIAELERKVQTLQTEATSLSAQLTLLQRDTNGLTCENSELKLRLQTMEQQVHLQDALNEAMKEEIQHLKMVTGQTMPNGGGAMMNIPTSFAASQPFYPSNQAMQTLLTAQQFQQLQIHHSQKQQQQQQHQFQQHQLHQLQQQQQLQQHKQQQAQQQSQLSADFKFRSVSDPKAGAS